MTTIPLCAVCAQVGPYSLLLRQRPGASGNTAHLQGQHRATQVRHGYVHGRVCSWQGVFMAGFVHGRVLMEGYVHGSVLMAGC